jgi:hypothetical protein
MAHLLLTEDLAHTLLGALLAVCRADGDASTDEMRMLRVVGEELTGRSGANEWRLFFSNVTPRTFAEAIHQYGHHGPFRGSAVSAPTLIVQEFVRAAVRVGRADGELNDSEIQLICAFATALGVSSKILVALDKSLDETLVAAENWG